MALPANIPKRGLSIDEASEYCGISRNTLLRHGPTPTKIGDRRVYDRRALDEWLDHIAPALARAHASGYTSSERDDPLMEAINARKDSVRNPAR